MLLTHARLFAPMDLRRRIFAKVAKQGWRDRLALLTDAVGEEAPGSGTDQARLYAAAFDASPQAQFVIDRGGCLTFFNEHARTLFDLVPSDVGRPIQDLELSYRPFELRSIIDQALEQQRPITLAEIEWQAAGRDPKYFEVRVTPLVDGTPRGGSVAVAFADTTRAHDLQVALDRSKQDLETAYEELQSTNEELETTNEELQSTVEELETTNEELQSTNEELETMNEELQSTNEELQTINVELRDRSEDLNRSNAFLASVLSGVRSSVVVLDRELHVIAWNERSEDLWGLRHEEVQGQNFLNLDIGLPTDQLRTSIRACLAGEKEFTDGTVTATNRRGRSITCRVTSTPLLGTSKEVSGVILLMEEQPTAH
jgi:two-component system CheB/CheR fusion protein